MPKRTKAIVERTEPKVSVKQELFSADDIRALVGVKTALADMVAVEQAITILSRRATTRTWDFLALLVEKRDQLVDTDKSWHAANDLLETMDPLRYSENAGE